MTNKGEFSRRYTVKANATDIRTGEKVNIILENDAPNRVGAFAEALQYFMNYQYYSLNSLKIKR